MKVHPLVMGMAVLLTAAVAWCVGRVTADSDAPVPPTRSAAVEAEAEATAPAPSRKEGAPSMTMRVRVARRVDEEVAPLRDLPEVDDYLERLRQRAAEREQVTALDVEPGIAAIRALEESIGPEEVSRRIEQFSEGMAALSKSFGHGPEPVRPLTPLEADDLLEEIDGENDNELKQRAIRAYLDRANAAPDPEEQERLLDRLDNRIAMTEASPGPPDMDVIAETIRNAGDNESMQAAISDYIKATQRLAPDMQMEAMARLDTLRN